MSEETTVVRSSSGLSVDDDRIEWPIRLARDMAWYEATGTNGRSKRDITLDWHRARPYWERGCFDVTLRAAPAAKPVPATCGAMFDATGVACNLPIGHVLLVGRHGVVAPAKPAAPVRALAPGWSRLAEHGRGPAGGLWRCTFAVDTHPASYRWGGMGACETHAEVAGVFVRGCIACGLAACDCSISPGATVAARAGERMKAEAAWRCSVDGCDGRLLSGPCAALRKCYRHYKESLFGLPTAEKPRAAGPNDYRPGADVYQAYTCEPGYAAWEAMQLGRAPGIDSERRRLPKVPARYALNDDPWLDIPDA